MSGYYKSEPAFPRDDFEHIHGGDVYSAEVYLGIDRSDILDFSANIMPAEIDNQVKDAIFKAIDNCRYYPDPQQRKLRQALAAHLDLEPGQIVCGNGAADLIYRVVHALKPDRAFLPVPSFAEYERALLEADCEINYWQLDQAHNFKIDQSTLNWLESHYNEGLIADKSTEDECRGLLIICQPNNPTGILIEPDILEQLIELCSCLGIYLLIDECFLDFLSSERAGIYSSLKYLDDPDKDKLMILRSMTKYYSMPGLRAGYLCTNRELAHMLLLTGQPWPVSTLTEAAVLAILNRDSTAHNQLSAQVEAWLAAERPLLEQALSEQGYEVWAGAANFIFFRAANCPDLKSRLMKQGIMIRSCADYVGLDSSYYRIAVLSHENNQRLLRALKCLCASGY